MDNDKEIIDSVLQQFFEIAAKECVANGRFTITIPDVGDFMILHLPNDTPTPTTPNWVEHETEVKLDGISTRPEHETDG